MAEYDPLEDDEFSGVLLALPPHARPYTDLEKERLLETADALAERTGSVWISCEKLRMTKSSVLLRTVAGDLWCPRSKVLLGHSDNWKRVRVARWWADKKGLGADGET